MKNSKIEWTHHTFNPWWGCVKVSEACAHCYAETFAKRTGHDVWGPNKPRRFFGIKHWNEPHLWNFDAFEKGERQRVFCASMADVFEDYQGPDKDYLEAARIKLWITIENTLSLDWLLLTKRPENILKMVPQYWLSDWPKNAWTGTTIESQEHETRITHLLKNPAPVHFLSCEPLLGPLDVEKHLGEVEIMSLNGINGNASYAGGIEWVICGGESGPGARPMHPAWARGLRDQCQAANVPFFFKQWGDWLPWEFDEQQFNDLALSQNGQELWNDDAPRDPLNLPKGWDYFEDLTNPTATLFQRVGKSKSGRLLDGKEWSQFPSPFPLLPPVQNPQ